MWRNLAVRVCDNPLLGNLAQRSYRFAAHRAARVLGKVEGVTGVALRGGALHHPVPGVSDIDLTVFLEGDLDLNSKDRILDLRQRYQKLKRIYPMLGEVLVLGPKDLRAVSLCKNSLLDQLTPQQLLHGREIPPLRGTVTFSGKFIQCFRYYEEMMSEWRKATSGSARSFHETRCRRYANKIHRVCANPSSRAASQTLVSVFADAFHQLHLLAEKAHAETAPHLRMKKIHMVWLNESMGVDEEEDKQRFLWWMTANQKLQHCGKLVVTKQAKVLVWQGEMSSESLNLLFSHFLKCSKDFPGEPLLLTPPIAEARHLGLTSDSPFLTAQWVTPERQNDPAWVERFKVTLFQRIQDHFLVNYCLLPFDFMALDQNGIIRVLRETCALAMILGNREIGEHITDSIEPAKKILPLTSRLYERVGEGKSYSFEKNELLGLWLGAREEMSDLIEGEFIK